MGVAGRSSLLCTMISPMLCAMRNERGNVAGRSRRGRNSTKPPDLHHTNAMFIVHYDYDVYAVCRR